MSMRVAIFGGTFDPIHKAHVAVAHAAAGHFKLDLVFFVPGAHPPHKAGITHAPYEDRVHMVELACAGEPRFKISRIEQNTLRSYSIDTIEKFRARLSPNDRLFFVIGADAFAEIHTWHRWRDVMASVCFLVVSRPGHRYFRPPDAHVERLDTVDMPVSSSEIRRILAAGGAPPEVPQAVLDYIVEKQLYRNTGSACFSLHGK